MKSFKQWIAVAVATFLITVPVVASTIHTFSNGEAITAANLNSVFQHIHNTMVGGHGARLVDADVNALAGIKFSKLETPALVPKAWGLVKATCTATPCTVAASSGISSITRTSKGLYAVNLTTARADTNYGVLVTPINSLVTTAADFAVCFAEGVLSTTQILVDCYENDGGAVQDTGFTIAILDNL